MSKDEYARSLAEDWSSDMDLFHAVAWPVIVDKLGLQEFNPVLFMMGYIAWKLDQIWTDMPTPDTVAGETDTITCAICSSVWHVFSGMDEAVHAKCPNCGHMNDLRVV